MKTFADYLSGLKPVKIKKDGPFVIPLSMTDWQEARGLLQSLESYKAEYEKKIVCDDCEEMKAIIRQLSKFV